MPTKDDGRRLITEYETWLDARSTRLATWYRADRNDCRQTLALHLLDTSNPNIAWHRALKDISREHTESYAVRAESSLPFDLLADYLDACELVTSDNRLSLEGPLPHDLLDQLTDRQWSICVLLVYRLTIPDIAERIGCSSATVNRDIVKIRDVVQTALTIEGDEK